MKKGLKTLLATLLATSCCTTVLVATGCGNSNNKSKKPTPPPAECTEHIDLDDNGYCDNCNEKMPDHGGEEEEDEYTISIDGKTSNDIDVGEALDLKWSVYKNGVKMPTPLPCTVTINDDSVTYDKTTGKVTAVKKGNAVATVTLDGDASVKATVRYTVHDYFFNHKLDRGEWNSAFEDAANNPHITINGGQAAVLVKEAATKFVFKYTLDMAAADIPTNQSFGIASFLPTSGAQVGDNALWFGVRGTNTRGVFGAFVKQFYDGWGSGDEYIQTGYSAIDVGFGNVEYVIIRDGLDYYYSINGYYGKYTVKDAAHANAPTYAGIYSQTVAFDVSNYTWSNSQTDVDAAIAQYYTNRGVAAISINESYKTDIVKGRNETFTAAAYPTDKAADATLVWTLDKTEMTEGAEETTITENDGVATLSVADPAAGYVYVVCSAEVDGKTISKRVRVEILQKDLSDSNDDITVYGGVELNDKDSDDWSITFPEDRMYQNGISITGMGNEEFYQKTNYCAILNTNYSKDYSLEFKFSNYKNNKNTPKLQVSLGADRSNFYLVYNAGAFRVETNTQGTQSNGFTTVGWHNTQWINDFDPVAEHTFKLTISDRGIYSVFIDGKQYGFYAVDGNQALTNPTTIVRKYQAYDQALPIKFATDGCSVKVSDIKVTDGTHESGEHNFWSEHQSYTYDDEDSFKMVVPIITDAGADGWQYGQWSDYKMFYTKTLDTSGYAIDLDVVFGSVMTDAKFVMRVGSDKGSGFYEIQFLNMSSGLRVECVKDNDWGNKVSGAVRVDSDNPLKVRARVEVRDNKLRVIANGKTIAEVPYATSQISSNSEVEFYMYNRTAGDVWSTANAKKYAEVSNFAVSGHEFVSADVYELENTASDNNIDIYYSMDNTPQSMPVRVLHNGAAYTPDDNYTLAYKLTSDDKEYFTFDEVNGTICGKDLAADAVVEGIVTVMLKNSDGDVLDSIDYHVAAYNKATSNDFVSVKGGVILDSTSATDQNYSLTFPMSKINVDGVGEQSKYEDREYSADLKAKVKGDFSIEFTVSDYMSTGNFPKLMVSLGGTNNQFYVVYNREGTVNHIESFVNASSTAGHGAGGWISSDEFESFNTAASHTYKITCIDGVYKVYLDGNELRFSFDSDNDHNTATLYRYVRDLREEMPIRIATNGVSAKVSNIKVEDLNTGEVSLPDFYSYQTGHTGMTDTGFTMQLAAASCKNNRSEDDAWNFRYSMYHKMSYLEPINTDTQIEFDVEFSGMKDGKLVMQTGSWEYHLMDKTGNNEGMLCQLFQLPNTWNPPTVISSGSANKTMHVVFERKNRQVWMYVNGIRVLNGRADADNSCNLDFFIFGGAEDIGKTLTVSNFVERPYSDATRYEYYELSAPQANIGIKPGNAATEIGFAITKNDAPIAANELPAGMTVDYSITESDYIKLDANHKVYATGEFTGTQTATVTIALKKDNNVIASVNVGITATAKETQNSTLAVSGGVLLNYTDEPDEAGWSVTFPQAMIGEDGIVNETRYVDATYSANLKKMINASENAVLQFTVTDFVTQGEYPKLMASLGGTHNQFYFVYRAGLGFRLEVVAPRINGDGNFWEDDGWLRSESTYDNTFDASIPHTFKIELKGGIYKVYRKDGNGEFAEIIVGEEWPAGTYTKGSHTMAMSYNDFMSQKKVRIATNNTACTISNVSLETTKSDFYYSAPFVKESDGTVIISASKAGWGNETSGGKKDRTQAYYIPGLANNQTMKFDLKFDTAMNDGKFAMNIAGSNYFIQNKVGSEHKLNICGNNDWVGQNIENLNDVNTVIEVTIVRNGANVSVTLKLGADSVTYSNTSNAESSSLYFWMFNENESEQNATATVSNVVVTNN